MDTGRDEILENATDKKDVLTYSCHECWIHWEVDADLVADGELSCPRCHEDMLPQTRETLPND